MTWHAVKWRPTLEKILGEVSCTECTDQENDFELIPMVKMGTRHPIDGYFGNEFPSICNHCGVMVAWSHKTLKNLDFLRFLEKRPLTGKFSKFCPKRLHRLTDQHVVLKFCEIWLMKNHQNPELLTSRKKKISPGSPDLDTAHICQEQPQTMYSQCPRFCLNWFTFGGVIRERVNTIKMGRNIQLNPSFESNNKTRSLSVTQKPHYNGFVLYGPPILSKSLPTVVAYWHSGLPISLIHN